MLCKSMKSTREVSFYSNFEEKRGLDYENVWWLSMTNSGFGGKIFKGREVSLTENVWQECKLSLERETKQGLFSFLDFDKSSNYKMLSFL